MGVFREPTALLLKIFAADGADKLKDVILSYWIEHSWLRRMGSYAVEQLDDRSFDDLLSLEGIFAARHRWLPYGLASSTISYQQAKDFAKGHSRQSVHAASLVSRSFSQFVSALTGSN
jgi:hypothetical protein